MSDISKKKIDESTFIIAKNAISNNTQLIVSPSGFQIGLKEAPADCTLLGRFSIATKSYVVNKKNDWTVTIDDYVTIALIIIEVSASGRPASGYAKIVLPNGPRDGQIVYVKDKDGKANLTGISIQSADGSLIDGSTTISFTTIHGLRKLCWYVDAWSIIGSS